MENVIKKTNKATLIAAALIITGATAIFGTYAAENEIAPQNGPGPMACYQMMNDLTDEQKAVMAEARTLFEAGKTDEAKALLEEAGIKPPRRNGMQGPRREFLENLTDEQKEMLKKAHELMQAGDTEAAQAIFDELGLERPENRLGNRPGKGFKKGFGPKLERE